jgi:crotonobetainyl-CoA:carnitine CoA-transferase CaiB-like acyl-CoA transferase
VRVVELAQWVFVPVAGALLADFGADVIRVERPDGDPYRAPATQGIGTDSGGVNLSVALANQGKRSVALDLRTERGRAVLDELLASADVFLTNVRPGALRRLGLDADALAERFPELVYARGHGYGVRGPDADLPGYALPTVPVQFDEEPPVPRRAPEQGELTEAVLLELGYDWERITELRDAGAIP